MPFVVPYVSLQTMDDEVRIRAQSAPTSRPLTAGHFQAEVRQSFDDEGVQRSQSRQGRRKGRTDKMDPKLAGSPFLQSIRPKKSKHSS